MQQANPVNKKIEISEDSYNRHMSAASSLGNYFIFRKCYLKIMSRDAALVLQEVMNKMGYLVRKGKLRSDRWVPFSAAKLEQALIMKRDCQQRILLELKGKGGKRTGELPFIEVTKLGRPPRRHIRINFVNLNRALDEAHSKIPDSPVSSNGAVNGISSCTRGHVNNPKSCTGGHVDPIIYNERLRKDKSLSETRSASPTVMDENQIEDLPHVDLEDEVSTSPDSNHINTEHKYKGEGCTSPDLAIPNTEHKYKNQIPTSEPTNDPAKLIANALWATLTRKNLLPINAKPKTWVQVIRKSLLPHVSLDTALAALAWYADHVGGKYIPDIRSARTLIDKWEALQSAIQRERQSTDPSKNADTLIEVKLTKPVKRVLKQLDHLHWPKGSRGQIPAVVASTMSAFTAFRKANSDLASRPGKYDLRNFAQWLIDEWSDDPEEFTVWWLEELNERVSNWSSWSGIVKGFSIDDKHFYKWLSDQVEEYGEDSRFAQRYLAEIKKNGLGGLSN